MLVDALSDYAIFVVSPAALIMRWNAGAENLFGYTRTEAIGQHFAVLFTPADIADGQPDKELAEALSGPKMGHDRWHVRKDGTVFWGMNTAQPLYDASHTLLGFTKIVHDLTEQHSASEALRDSERKLRILVKKTQHASLHDDLTGLANRALFREYLGRALATAERHPERNYAVLFLDIDNFKTVNDTFGHSLADQLLVQVTSRLGLAIRTTDVLARLGGDEFAILLQDIDGEPGSIATAERITHLSRTPFTIEGHEISTSISVGIAVASHAAKRGSTDDILRDADLAMYEAKSQGGERYVLYQDVMRTRAGAVLQLDKDLRKALERDELRILYEPVIDIATEESPRV